MTNLSTTEPWPDGTGVPDVPDVSASWFLRIVDAVAAQPEPVQASIALAAQVLPVLIAALLAVAVRRARRETPEALARAVAAPAVTAVAYLTSEIAKQVMDVDRPCRLVGAVATLEGCPPVGDWSFPSNHATVAGAAAVAILWCSRPLGAAAVVVALATAASRVLIGVHFPHDVLVGLALGATVAVLLMSLLSRVLRPVVDQTAQPGRTRPLS